MDFKPAGIAYFNLVWNNEVLWDMVKGVCLALIVVFAILAYDFRSVKWAVVGYMPLLFTIVLIYGVIGFSGKDFDMPISVLSTLSLGMAVDFAIHFVSRFRRRLAETNAAGGRPGKELIADSLLWTAARPGKGIMRNAILFDKASYLPLKEQYYDRRGELLKVFTADEVKTIKGFPTIKKRTMKNMQSGHSTLVTFEKTGYNLGLSDNLFSERFMKQQPRKWIE